MKNNNFKFKRYFFLFGIVLACLLIPVQTINAQKKGLKSGFAEVNGTRLFYEIAGEGSPVVLIHGGLVDMRMWDNQFHKFAQKHLVIRYDLRGFGKSVASNEVFSHIDDLFFLLKFLNIKKASLVGLSLGGIIATDFTIDHPEMVEKLILVSAALRGDLTPPDEETIAVYRTARQPGMEKAVELWMRHPLFATGKNNVTFQKEMRQMLKDNFDGWKPNPSAVKPTWAKALTIENLGNINKPTFIILGEKDAPVILRIGKILKDKIPSAELMVIPEVSHHLNMEQPKKFNQIVLVFLKK